MKSGATGATGATGASGAVRCTGARVRCTGAQVLALLALAIPLAAADRYADIEITPLIHSSVQLERGGKVVPVDPWSAGDLSRAKLADLILITDDVGHHLDMKAIQRLRKPEATDAAGGSTLPVSRSACLKSPR